MQNQNSALETLSCWGVQDAQTLRHVRRGHSPRAAAARGGGDGAQDVTRCARCWPCWWSARRSASRRAGGPATAHAWAPGSKLSTDDLAANAYSFGDARALRAAPQRHGVDRVLHAGRRRHRASAAVRGPGGRASQARVEDDPSAPRVRVPRGARGLREGRGVESARRGVHARARGGRTRESAPGVVGRAVERRRERPRCAVHGGRDPGATPGENPPRRAKVVQPSTSKR